MTLLDRLYRRLGPRYFATYVVFQVVSSLTVTLATAGLFALYEPLPAEEFWMLVAVASVSILAALAWRIRDGYRFIQPVMAWLRSGRGRRGALDAWCAAVSVPREFVTNRGWLPFAAAAAIVCVDVTVTREYPFWTAGMLFAGSIVAVAYASILHFFASELFLRPVVADIAAKLPPDFSGRRVGVPLRWKLLGALPLINVITGVVVSGLSAEGQTSVADLGVDVFVAVLVAFTISLELTILLAKSVLRPVDDLLRATDAVKRGDLRVRVPVVSGDEMGALASSFNEMMRGLSEREALREAFGSYVDPEVAERVLEEGELLEGQEREVSVMFVDVRDFTPLAERSSARETVAFLNEFFELVVPIVRRHGGHANKFLGDGILAVFGAPERLRNHADRALAAACEVAGAVGRHFDGRTGVGIGVNSGPVVIGSVGGGGRLEFAVIGDPVNVAARVEAATRETGDTVLLTEATRCLLERPAAGLEPRGEVTLKGKSDPVRVYSAEAFLDGRPAPEPERLTAEA